MPGKKRQPALSKDWVTAYAPPVDASMPQAQAADPPKAEHAAGKAADRAPHQPTAEEPTIGPKKVRAVFYLPELLLHEARNAVVHLAGFPEYLNLTKLAEHAIRSELDRLKKEHLAGKAFPAVVVGRLKGGRPVGS